MLGLKYKIVGSRLEVLEQNSITQNSKNQFECQFEFSDEWDKLTKFCVFEVKGQDPICVEIEDNKCMVSAQAAKSATFKTGVFGISEEATYTTNYCMFFVNSSVCSYLGVDDDTTKSLYEQFILDVVAIRDEAKGYADSASQSVEQYPKVIDGLLYFWDVGSQEFVQTEFQDGLSAYELAVNQGFEGDIEEWTQSLKGEKGDTGDQGIQGEKGDAFIYDNFTDEQLMDLKGDTGEQGRQGEKGDTGDTYELTDSDRQEIAELSQEEVTNARTSFEGEVQDSLDERINTDIAMLLDRFNSATSIPYEGESIIATNSYMGMSSDLEIQGQTYQNLARLDLSTSELFSKFNGILSDGVINLQGDGTNYKCAFYNYNFYRYKNNVVYTVILNIFKNTCTKSIVLNAVSSGEGIWKAYKTIDEGTIGVLKFSFTVSKDNSEIDVLETHLSPSDTGEISYSFIILEGNYANIDLPDNITDIESTFGNLVVTSKDLEENTYDFAYKNIELRRIGDSYDSISNNKLTQRIATRNYCDGDLELENVLVDNDLTTTYYVLDEPIITELDTRELKTYDGTTYITSSGSNISPIISVRIPSDVGAVIAEVSAANSEITSINEILTQELETANQTIDKLLSVE